MNQTIELLLNRRSYRNFDTNYKLDNQELDLILKASKQAPSSMNLQLYSIIVVDNQELKEKIFELNPRNPQIKDCSVFFVYVMDFYRSQLASKQYGTAFEIEDKQDTLLLGSIDASLAMQNAIIASESLGLKSVCIGGVRGIAKEISELLQLPDYVFPICGLCIGKTLDENSNHVKPRIEGNVFFNQYDLNQEEAIKSYDEVMEKYSDARETAVWSEKASRLSNFIRVNTNEDLKDKKF